MKYGELNLGQMEAIVNKLGGMDGVKRFLSGELTIAERPMPSSELKVFKTVTLGSSAKAYRKSLKSANFRISEYADEILGKAPMAAAQTHLDLVVLSVAELGFPNGATRDQIYTRAQERGLSLCPAEVGPALRLAYPEQPAGEWLLIAMEPITASGGGAFVFRVEHGSDGRWLGTYWSHPGSVWYAEGRWVFWRK